MKIVILPSARDDLSAGFAFYEDQAEGLETHFLETLFIASSGQPLDHSSILSDEDQCRDADQIEADFGLRI